MGRLQNFAFFAVALNVVSPVVLAACATAAPVDAIEEERAGTDPGSNDTPGSFSPLPSQNEEPSPGPNNQQGAPCSSPGETQKCFDGDPSMAGLGTCTWGTQTCAGSGEFAQWGPCVGSGAPSPAACDGIDHLCNGQPDANCKCTPGATISCYTGPKATENVGRCRSGTQTCNGAGDGWGPCNGEIKPSAEVCSGQADYDCDGAKGCADGQCATNPTCKEIRQTFCNAAGSFKVTGVRFRAASVLPVSVCSGQGSSCGSLTTGGTFTANCAGQYQVCASVPTTRGCSIASSLCVNVSVPTDGATVSLPPIPGFGPLSTACVGDCFRNRAQMSVTLGVTGQTNDGVVVNKAAAATSINPTTCVLGGDNGGGGGGGF